VTGVEGLNRDVSLAQYNTKEGGLQGGFTVDDTLVNTLMDPEKAYTETVKQVVNGLNDAKKTADLIYDESGKVVENASNAVEYGHFTTDDKVKSYLSMDAYEKKIENGDPVSAQDKLNYYGSKNFVGEPLSPEEQLDLNQAVQVRKIEVANDLKQNILDTWKTSTGPIVSAKLEALRELDPTAAAEIDVKFARVNASEKQKAVIIENKDTVLANANDGLVYEKSPEKNGGIRETLEGWGQGLNSWGTEKNKVITNSTLVQSGHKYGEYLNANPDVALATCFGAGVVGTGVPILAATSETWVPAVIAVAKSDKAWDTGWGAATNVVLYAATTDKENWSLTGAGKAALIGGATGFIASPLTGDQAYTVAMNTATRLIGGGAIGTAIDAGSQYIDKGNYKDINLWQSAAVGANTAVGVCIGGLQTDAGIKYIFASGLANAERLIPSVTTGYVVDKLINTNKVEDNKSEK